MCSSDLSLMVGMTFYIYTSAKEVTFVNGNCSDTRIDVSRRSEKLVLNFDNVTMKAKSNNSVIDAYYCSDLEIYSYNYVKLTAGEVNEEDINSAAILCENLTLAGNKIEIYGGDLAGGYGFYKDYVRLSHATAGIKCTDVNKTLSIEAAQVKVKGGDGKFPFVSIIAKDGTEVGEKGEDGFYGCDGSDGAVAIYFNGDVIVSLGCEFKCIGGAGGNGGVGGRGGKGGPGSGVAIKSPGNGGNGGRGGDGGDGAKPIVCKSFTGNTSGLMDGKGGAGGAGGEGGEPGDPVTTILGKKYGKKGADGANGEPGKTGVSELA